MITRQLNLPDFNSNNRFTTLRGHKLVTPWPALATVLENLHIGVGALACCTASSLRLSLS